MAKSGAQAVFFAGGTGAGTVALWQAAAQRRSAAAAAGLERHGERIVHLADRRGGGEHLSDDSDPAGEPLSALGRAGACGATAAALAAKRNANALYGYEAMSVVLDAIRRAGCTGTTARL